MPHDTITLALLALGAAWGIAAAPELLWALRGPFLWASWLTWALHGPLRGPLNAPDSPWPRRVFLAALPLWAVWGLGVWVALTPVRVAEAVYYDLLLFPAVAGRDLALDLLRPRRAPYRDLTGRAWAIAWIRGLPRRLGEAALRAPKVVAQAVAMALMDLWWPSLTLYHGTRFEQGATAIAQTGLWLVGRGDYVGEGIYFGVRPSTARYYARGSTGGAGSWAVVVARVTLAPCRPVATLPEDVRRHLGGAQSRDLSRRLPWPWASLEHWREDRGWWEYNLAQPGRQGTFVSSWRIRPVCVLREGVPAAIRSGLAFWPASGDGWAVLTGTACLVTAAALGAYTR